MHRRYLIRTRDFYRSDVISVTCIVLGGMRNDARRRAEERSPLLNGYLYEVLCDTVVSVVIENLARR
jgi:hypothetical protein